MRLDEKMWIINRSISFLTSNVEIRLNLKHYLMIKKKDQVLNKKNENEIELLHELTVNHVSFKNLCKK